MNTSQQKIEEEIIRQSMLDLTEATPIPSISDLKEHVESLLSIKKRVQKFKNEDISHFIFDVDKLVEILNTKLAVTADESILLEVESQHIEWLGEKGAC